MNKLAVMSSASLLLNTVARLFFIEINSNLYLPSLILQIVLSAVLLIAIIQSMAEWRTKSDEH